MKRTEAGFFGSFIVDPVFVCLFRFIHTVWHTCENWREQDPKYSSADGSPLSREYNSNIVLANLKLI